jgi:hypothetical protein
LFGAAVARVKGQRRLGVGLLRAPVGAISSGGDSLRACMGKILTEEISNLMLDLQAGI